ncbi:MAG: SO_0444 family Cu/Zn efflux transporter [Phycisphaerae bacterium]|nr:SO_0444 family Cu/Zn efflux transporter [Phycisphaerae bacterium]
MQSVLIEIWRILNESAIYLLFGFALAGFLHVALRRTPRFTNLLAARGGRSVVLAALLGVPLPLCSCSVLPAGLTLRKKGASKGATVSFLISVPETDIVSILLTYGLLGPVMAVFRPLAAIVTAIVSGQLTNLVDRWTDAGSQANAEEESCACKEEDDEGYVAEKGPIWNALHYGFVRFFGDIIGSLLLGLIIGGLITAFLPRFGLEDLVGASSILTMLAMLVVGIPMYVCATASTPIAAGLIASGLSPGAALVFLLAGPATNIGSLLVLGKHLGRAVLITYLCSIAVISVLMGLWLDAAFDAASISLPAIVAATGETPFSPVKTAGAILLLVLAYMSLRRTGAFEGLLGRINRALGLELKPRRVKLAAVVFLLIAYACSSLFVVRPGERAVVTRFGRITQANLLPGLHCRWPYPIGRTDIESVTRIKRIELGYRRSPKATDDDAAALAGQEGLTAESWMLTGHEDIIDITWVVQYRVMDSEDGKELEKYLYGLADREALVRSAADSAIRVAVGNRGIDKLLTTARGEVEDAVRGSLQASLDECDAGIGIVHVGLISVHAPEEVHWAFRDLASASEDRMKKINEAEEYKERVVPEAEGGRRKRVLAAEGTATQLVRHAIGESSAFMARLTAYRERNPAVTRLRLYFESMDAVLPSLKKYVCLSKAVSEGIDLWLIKGDVGVSDLKEDRGLANPAGLPDLPMFLPATKESRSRRDDFWRPAQ